MITNAAGVRTIALASLAFALAGVSGGCHDESAPAHRERAERERAPVPVRVHPVAVRRVPRQLEVTGVVEAIERIAIASEVTGRVVRVVGREGTPVAAGDLLVELDRERLEARRDEARANLAYARARAEVARTHRERIERLFERGSAPRQALDEARAADAQAASAVDRARASLAGAEVELARTRIVAPRAGVVVEKSVAVGDTAIAGRPLLVLEDRARVEVLAAVPVERAADLAPGIVATLIPNGDAGRAFTAPVARIVPSADRAARTVSLRVPVDNADRGLVPGGFVRCLLPAGSAEVIRLPADAVTRRGSIAFVHVVGADGRAERRLVDLGRVVDDEVEILSGVQRGELVVIASAEPLADGVRVEIEG